jgi:hypothetical protein
MSILISTFSVVADEEGSGKRKDRLAPRKPVTDPGIASCLTRHNNSLGFSYEENHLEEWIARQPSALFGATPVLLLVSQNYRHLGVKIDLLFVDAKCRMYPVELKVVRVAKNGGVVPYDLYERQMKPYVEFLNATRHLGDLDRQYVSFTARFNGAASHLVDDFAAKFGQLPCDATSPILEVYVAEDFDTYALEYFSDKSSKDGRSVRLVSYKFFPKDRYIEFWNVYQTPEDPT